MSKSTAINLNNDLFVGVQMMENLYRTCVQNRVCKSNNEFYCYLCKFATNELIIILKHIQYDKEHQQRNKIGEINTEMLNNLHIDEIESVKIVLNGLIVINAKDIHCIICANDLTSLKDADNHIKGKRHKNCKGAKPITSNASSLCSSSSSVNICGATESVNILSSIKPVTVFNCNYCKIILRSNAQYKYHRMFHLSPVRYSCCDIDIINFSLQEDKTRFMHCSICDKLLNNEDELENHLSDIKHFSWVNFIQRTKEFPLIDDFAVHLTNLDIDCSTIFEYYPISFSKCSYCQVCKLSTPYSDDPSVFSAHETGKRHQKNLNSTSIQDKNFESTSISDNCVPAYLCFICSIECFDENSLYIHYKEEIHQFRAKILLALTSDKHLSILQTDKDNSIIQCTICNVVTNDALSIISHIFGSKHKKKIKLNVPLPVDDKNLDVNLESNESLLTLSSDLKNKSYFDCPICEVKVSSDFILVQHLESKKHIKKVAEYNATDQATAESKLFTCHICEEAFFTDTQLMGHFKDIRHQNKIKAKCENNNKYTDSINETVLVNEYISIFKTDKDNVMIQCAICNIETADAESMISHIYGPKSEHKKKFNETVSRPSVKFVDDILDNNVESSETLSTLSSDLKNSSYFDCPICEVKVPRDFMLVQHLESKKHMKKVVEYNATDQATAEPKLFTCHICEEGFFTDTELLGHFHDIGHQNRVQAKCENKNKLTDFVSETGVEVNNSASAKEDLSKEENQKNVSTFPLKKKSKRRRRLKEILSTLSSENLSGIGEKYIELCIKPGPKNIYNVDANELYKLRMAISLSIPTGSNGRYCIPCNTEISSHLQMICEHSRDAEHVKKVSEIVANDKPYSTDPQDYYNDFSLACSYMRKSSDNDVVLCFACLMKIKNLDTSSIFDHMNSKAHIDNCSSLVSSSEMVFQKITKTMQAAWYFAEKFICEICCVKYASEINFVQHLMQDQHIEKVNQALVNGDVYEFGMCASCATYWYGKPDYYEFHYERSLHKHLLKYQDHVIPKLADLMESILNNYEDTISHLLHESHRTNRKVKKSLLNSLEMVMRDRYPQVKAYIFGSRLSSTSSDNSVLDIYLDCEDTYCSFKSAEQIQEQFLEIWKRFEEHAESMWTIEEIFLSVRIPIVKLRHRSTNRRCDVQCVNGLVVEKSKLIGFFVKAFPTCRQLCLFLEKWLSLSRLSETRGITSNYAISMLVIFYLQTENILPSISDLIKQKNQSKIVAGWEVGFFENTISVPQETYTMKDYLSRFFDYYANFNYITDVICPFLGRPALKWDFVNFDKLPEEMNIYKSLYESKNAEVFYFDSPMCLQDPIELSENLTMAVTKQELRAFQQYCSQSKTILDKV